MDSYILYWDKNATFVLSMRLLYTAKLLKVKGHRCDETKLLWACLTIFAHFSLKMNYVILPHWCIDLRLLHVTRNFSSFVIPPLLSSEMCEEDPSIWVSTFSVSSSPLIHMFNLCVCTWCLWLHLINFILVKWEKSWDELLVNYQFRRCGKSTNVRPMAASPTPSRRLTCMLVP